eukprot:jgi/Tetstr1/439347/TSEL_027785.t1
MKVLITITWPFAPKHIDIYVEETVKALAKTHSEEGALTVQDRYGVHMVVMDAAQGKTADDDYEPSIAYCGDTHLQLSSADMRYLAKEAGAGRIVQTIVGTSGLSPFMKKMDMRMALVTLTNDFGRPVRPMLPSAGTSGVVCANWTCEDYLHFTETMAVLVLGEECRRVNEYIKKPREEGRNCLLTYAQMCGMHLHDDMMKLNMHNLVCRVRPHEAARGSTARDSEL